MQEETLCFLTNNDKILLAMKKRGFGVGKWNGVGGKIKKEESIEQAVQRETKEEIMVDCRLEDLESVVLRGNKIEGEFYFNADGSNFDSFKIRLL